MFQPVEKIFNLKHSLCGVTLESPRVFQCIGRQTDGDCAETALQIYGDSSETLTKVQETALRIIKV